VAIVTGASQGIGCAIAVDLARVGAHVVVCSVLTVRRGGVHHGETLCVSGGPRVGNREN